MIRLLFGPKPAQKRLGRLLSAASLAALGVAASFHAAPARAQDAFGTMVGMQAGRTIGPNGQVSVWSGADQPTVGTDADGRPLMTIIQRKEKALLDWEDFRLKTNEVLEFQQQAANWIAVNRVHGKQAAEVNGEIRAKGSVFILNENGVLIGKDAKINTRTLVTGRGFSDVDVSGDTMTLVQSDKLAALDWSNMSLAAGKALKIQQEKNDWIALNRSYDTNVTRIDGKVSADGHVYFVAPSGLSVDGQITARQVVLSSLFMRNDQFFDYGLRSVARDYNGRFEPTFSNSYWNAPGSNGSGVETQEMTGYNPLYQTKWIGRGLELYDLLRDGPTIVDPNDPLKYNVTIGRNGSVTTGAFGKVMLFGPDVTNRGTISVQDEGQVIFAAGENIYLNPGTNGRLDAYIGAYNPLAFGRTLIQYRRGTAPQTATTEEWAALYSELLGRKVAVGEKISYDDFSKMFNNGQVDYRYMSGGLYGALTLKMQAKRAREVGYTARNEGIIRSTRGGSVDFRGLDLQQMGGIEMTSTALFRGNISFHATAYDWRDYANGDGFGEEDAVKGHGIVTFGRGSLTQITPDLESKDRIALSLGKQSVGSLKINANSVNMQQDSLIYMPSGKMNVMLDAGRHVFDNNRGAGANQGNEDGTRFFMDTGAKIDLSGWRTTLDMGYHQVTGKLFAAQLSDSPVQRDGPLYRKEISVDRRFGTNLANWNSFDNLAQGTLAQFLTDGGTLSMDIGNDFIMKKGSVIDVSGGVTTYRDGYVYTSMLRRLDGSVIDIREADPDEIYMGLANEWVVYDTKWGKQSSYHIPLISSVRGRYETSYEHGGAGGKIEILAPDTVLQGTLSGHTVAGRYQRRNIPKGGSFILNNAGESEGEYVSNTVLITAIENALRDNFGFKDMLSDTYGDLFGKEFDPETSPVGRDDAHRDNATLTSADFFNRSTMGSYSLTQNARVGERDEDGNFVPLPGDALTVEAGANIILKNGASLLLSASERLGFYGNIRTEGGAVELMGMKFTLGDSSKIDTRGSWYSDFEIEEPIALTSLPRIDGGTIKLMASGSNEKFADVGLVLPKSVVLDSSGGAWVDRNGKLVGGKGGDLQIIAYSRNPDDVLELGALENARAYGLGGNGKFAMEVSKPLYIGTRLPDDSEAGEDDLPSLLITPGLFERSGYSAVTLLAPAITVQDGLTIAASSATMQLRDQSLHNGRPPSFWTPSGTDIYDVTEIGFLEQGLRTKALRRGMDINFTGTTTIGKESVFSTEIGGSFKLLGNATIAGTLLAPGGNIYAGVPSDNQKGSYVRLLSTGKLLAPGAALITWRGIETNGRELVDGVVYNGGKIELGAIELDLAKGAVLDVSGANALFDLQTESGSGDVVRMPTRLASNGGQISLTGRAMSVDDATYRAHSGGAGAAGGSFALRWVGVAAGEQGSTPQDPGRILDTIARRFSRGTIVDIDGKVVRNLYGTDLSRINWQASFGRNIELAPGFTLTSRDDVTTLLKAYTVAAAGIPPMLIVGAIDDMNVKPPVAPDVPQSLFTLLKTLGYYEPPVMVPSYVTTINPKNLEAAGFSALKLEATPGIIFSGDVSMGGRRADGTNIYNNITLTAPKIMGRKGANVRLEAGVITLSVPVEGGAFDEAKYLTAINVPGIDVAAQSKDAHIELKARTLLEVASANFYGFADTKLSSGGDIRFSGMPAVIMQRPKGQLHAVGDLVLKADQIYAGTGRIFSVKSDSAITILTQDDGGPINGSPYEAAAELTFRAPTILQAGTVRSPLGTIGFDAYATDEDGTGLLTFAPNSLTSVSAEGRVIPYGYTSNGDTWLDPFTGLELTTLPTKGVTIKGDIVDMRSGSVLDVSGGGNLFAREFVPGVGGTLDWLTGYRDKDYKWVQSPQTIYAVMPGYDGNIAPLGFGRSEIGVGDKVYLSGGGGLAAGYYTLLPAEYALLPGAFRVTANHRYDGFADVRLGAISNLSDGSSIQSGYRVDGASEARDQRAVGYHVMPGKSLRMRSTYIETLANSFFTSDAFLRKALRINRPVADIPLVPLDGGSVKFRIGKSINLDGRMKAAPGQGGRGGFADITGPNIVVAGANTDLADYAGYIVLDSDQLSAFGAESLLIGGLRRQGTTNMELTVDADTIIVDNRGSVLKGPELLLAASGKVDIAGGARIATERKLSGKPGDLRIVSTYGEVLHDNGTSWTKDDDYIVHGALDRGVVMRVSSGDQIDLLRNGIAVSEMNKLRKDPEALAALNKKRAQLNLAPVAVDGGILTIADGASISASRSVALDATVDTRLGGAATVTTQQLSAAASQVSIGAVPAGTEGLVFASGSLGNLANASDLTLKSYGSVDFYGDVTLATKNGLRLDTREVRLIGGAGNKVNVNAGTLTLANSSGGEGTANGGDGELAFNAQNIFIEGGAKWIAGADKISLTAAQRIIGRDDTALNVPANLTLTSGEVTAESGSRLALNASGNVDILSNGTSALPAFQSFGATVAISGEAVHYAGRSRINGGTINLRARSGDLVLAQGSVLDVTSDVRTFFDQKVGVGAGTVNLVADLGNIAMRSGALIDVSGSLAGGNAGKVSASAGEGGVTLAGTLRGNAQAGYASGTFSLLTSNLGNFAAFNGLLDAGGFRQGRHFEINHGDVVLDGSVDVQNLTVIANAGSINVTGTVTTSGEDGGTIQLSANRNILLSPSGKLIARARNNSGTGGTVLLETLGSNGGIIRTDAGSLIDVSGRNNGGSIVRFRAPQQGNDIAIGTLAGTITGARSVTAEGYRVYDKVGLIDQSLIDRVEGDARAFMTANGAAIRTRLGGNITLTAGIELRSDADMELATDWDLSKVRFNGAAGALTLRAKGDLKINANLSDGFDGTRLLDGDSWSFTLAGGANITSPYSQALLLQGLLEAGRGSVIIGGTPDTIEYFYDPAYGNEHRLYRLEEGGKFARVPGERNPNIGFIELARDAATGKYLDPLTGALIEKDSATGDYADTGHYARRPLPWIHVGWGMTTAKQDGTTGYIIMDALGGTEMDMRDYQQWNNATGYHVRTGTGTINLAAGRDFILKERPSVLYTAGRIAQPLAGFYVPADAQYAERGGDVSINVTRDIVSSGNTPQMPTGYLRVRGSLDQKSGLFATAVDRAFDQSSWWVDHTDFEGGVGALGGGNVSITAGGDIRNLGVALPDNGRVTGNTVLDGDGESQRTALTRLDGGNLALRAGGNLYGGVFYVANGKGDLDIGGSVQSGSRVMAAASRYCESGMACYLHQDYRSEASYYDLYSMFFTSSGKFDIKSGGDLNIESIMDPLIGSTNGGLDWKYTGYTDDAKARLFSAGGNVTLWTNGYNISLAYMSSGRTRFSPVSAPLFFYGSNSVRIVGNDSPGWDLYPSKLSVIAATGDVRLLGGITMLPSATGQLDLLAGRNVYIGYGTQAVDPFLPNLTLTAEADNYRGAYQGLFMSQADMELIRQPTTQRVNAGFTIKRADFWGAGSTGFVYGHLRHNLENLPDLHLGDTVPVRIYAAGGDVVTANTAALTIPKQTWVQASGNVYFPSYRLQHNNANDLSLVRAGKGIYFDKSYELRDSLGFVHSKGMIEVSDPGRLEIEAGTDIWLPSNSLGITSKRIMISDGAGTGSTIVQREWQPDLAAADIAVSAGFNQQPSYTAFDDAYLNPAKAAGIADYLKDDGTGLSIYLFDRTYARAANATGEFATPENREGLVNYVRKLQGLPALATKAEQAAYVDQAWAYWQAMPSDMRTPYYRSVLFLELRTTGREANDPESPRQNSTIRGYTAIQTLFPGAQRDMGEAPGEGESRWTGNFETYASRVLSTGGGKVEFVIPGGALLLANVAAKPADTGQPAYEGDRGNALRAGILTTDGGEVNIFTRGSVEVNQSRILTSKGGNVLIWSSWGDIAAGKGAKTSISPQFHNYDLGDWAHLVRTPAGLPTGAGIGTLATQEGVAPADVDLIAPAGIVDAGDAGIRVSGNFNVFALEILGTDNIDVAGVSSGLPTPPAAPPTSLDVGDVASKTGAVDRALDEAVASVRENAAIIAPSIIEVHITGYGAVTCGTPENPCPRKDEGARRAPLSDIPEGGNATAPVQVAMQEAKAQHYAFDIKPQSLGDAVRAIGQVAGINIVYDARLLKGKSKGTLRGKMTPEQALDTLLEGEGMRSSRIAPRTIVLRRQTS